MVLARAIGRSPERWLYLVTELVSGRTLQEVMTQESPLPLAP